MSHSENRSSESTRWIDRGARWLRASLFGLPAWPFFLGVVLSFAGCALAGRVASRQPMFENFVRFFSPIQPQRYFYPTASQLVTHIRTHVPHNKTLVLVGGASYFRGTGQNPKDLWSLELQRQLGKDYAVVNFATDRADLTAFAAVVFEILAREYPNMVYVANGATDHSVSVDGGEDYRYIFWDAYYKGLLLPEVAKAPAVQEARHRQMREAGTRETHLGAWLDSYAYANDLWTYISYKYAFTVWVDEQYRNPFRARIHETEGDDPNIAQRQADTRKDAAYVKHSETFAKNTSKNNFKPALGDTWEPDPLKWADLEKGLRGMMPESLRGRCYVVLLRGNPFFMQTLTPEERERSELIYELGKQAYEKVGYKVVTLRAADFTADDFVDGGHLMASGGVKVARTVAAKIDDKDRTQEAALPLNAPRGGPLEVAFALPNDRARRIEPLVTLASGGALDTFFIEYLGGENLRLGYQAAGADAPIFSPPFVASIASAIHSIRVSLGSLYPRTVAETNGLFTTEELAGLKSWMLLRLDERPFWEVPVAPRFGAPAEILLGINPRSPIPNDRFTGTFYLAERRPANSRTLRRNEIGGARVTLTLTPDMKGKAYPLVTTGKAGEGDVLFFRVTEQGGIILGYDHWGRPSMLSPEVPVGLGGTHTIEFRVPALDAAAAPEVKVSLDGKSVWTQAVPVYRPAPDHVYFGSNPIGATCSESALPHAAFEGVLAPNWRG